MQSQNAICVKSMKILKLEIKQLLHFAPKNLGNTRRMYFNRTVFFQVALIFLTFLGNFSEKKNNYTLNIVSNETKGKLVQPIINDDPSVACNEAIN